jgi:chromosome segregation ATPase
MSDSALDRLAELEAAVRRTGEALARLRADNEGLRAEQERLRKDIRRLEDERKQVLGQIDAILKDIGKLDLGTQA